MGEVKAQRFTSIEVRSQGVVSVPVKPAGTLYRGHEGMWSWVGQRITGVAVFFFLLIHVLDTSLVRVAPGAYNAVIGTYKNPILGLGEAALVAAILFHALNGLRIIAVDFWKHGPQYQRQLLWGVLILWALLLTPFLIRHLSIVLSPWLGGHA